MIAQKFQQINKHLVDQDKRIDDLRQEWKFGNNNAHVAAGGGAGDILPGN